jgi:hypothetical protein
MNPTDRLVFDPVQIPRGVTQCLPVTPGVQYPVPAEPGPPSAPHCTNPHPRWTVSCVSVSYTPQFQCPLWSLWSCLNPSGAPPAPLTLPASEPPAAAPPACPPPCGAPGPRGAGRAGPGWGSWPARRAWCPGTGAFGVGSRVQCSERSRVIVPPLLPPPLPPRAVPGGLFSDEERCGAPLWMSSMSPMVPAGAGPAPASNPLPHVDMNIVKPRHPAVSLPRSLLPLCLASSSSRTPRVVVLLLLQLRTYLRYTGRSGTPPRAGRRAPRSLIAWPRQRCGRGRPAPRASLGELRASGRGLRGGGRVQVTR